MDCISSVTGSNGCNLSTSLKGSDLPELFSKLGLGKYTDVFQQQEVLTPKNWIYNRCDYQRGLKYIQKKAVRLKKTVECCMPGVILCSWFQNVYCHETDSDRIQVILYRNIRKQRSLNQTNCTSLARHRLGGKSGKPTWMWMGHLPGATGLQITRKYEAPQEQTARGTHWEDLKYYHSSLNSHWGAFPNT